MSVAVEYVHAEKASVGRGHIRNVSISGVFIERPQNYAPKLDDRLRVYLKFFSEATAIWAEGVVVRVEEEGFAIQFCELDACDAARLTEVLPLAAEVFGDAKGTAAETPPAVPTRRQPRYRVTAPVGYVNSENASAGYGQIHDISVSGVFVEQSSGYAPKLEDHLAIHLKLFSKANAVSVGGTVIRVEETGFAVEFQEVDPINAATLGSMLALVARTSDDTED